MLHHPGSAEWASRIHGCPSCRYGDRLPAFQVLQVLQEPEAEGPGVHAATEDFVAHLPPLIEWSKPAPRERAFAILQQK